MERELFFHWRDGITFGIRLLGHGFTSSLDFTLRQGFLGIYSLFLCSLLGWWILLEFQLLLREVRTQIPQTRERFLPIWITRYVSLPNSLPSHTWILFAVLNMEMEVRIHPHYVPNSQISPPYHQALSLLT